MKLLFIALAVSFVLGEDVLPLADSCDEELCQLPNCRCSSPDIPGSLAARDTPQFVTVTFDDAINIRNIQTYREILYQRRNSNGCPSGFTFHVNHEYTDYQGVNELYNQGFEIALLSITRRTPQTFWAEATYEDMVEEFSDQRQQMAHFANIPREQIKGMRIPFLQLAGNSSFQMMVDSNILYDSSWPTIAHTNPALWPYTLDYASTQDCPAQPCPTASIPGAWVQPLVSWTDLEGFPCAMVDSCFAFPDREDEDAWFQFIVTNFERHYLTNRAPFGLNIHEWYVDAYPAVKNALSRFLDLVSNLNDAFLVNSHEVIDWVRNPVSINEYRQQPCRTFTRTTCSISSCGPLVAEHNSVSYYFQICNECPRVYPWIGNPLGL